MPNNKEIIRFLTTTTTNAGFIDRLKIKYRPIICPFNDLLRYIEESRSVFDIGCGSGQYCSLVANFTSASKIKGIEINPQLIKNAKEINLIFREKKQMEFEVFDGKHLPNDLIEYDIVFLIDVIHHVPKSEQKDFIFEIQSKMKKGAKLIFKDINKSHPFVGFNKIHDLVFAGEIGNELKASEAKKILIESGFQILEERFQTVFVYPHYYIICIK